MRYSPTIVSRAALATLAGTAEAQKKTLVIALNQDPDVLDPTPSRTYVGRIIFTHMCEKLYESDERLNIVPQLAAGLPAFTDGGKTATIKLRPGVKFNDGTPFTAEAMKFSLDRHRTMKGSNRASELALVHEVDVTRFLFDEEIVSIQIIKPSANPGAPEGLADPQIAIMRTASAYCGPVSRCRASIRQSLWRTQALTRPRRGYSADAALADASASFTACSIWGSRIAPL
jgi:MarR-like DNA-binding transcriptional regulator SgrR of sgrS sRNA